MSFIEETVFLKFNYLLLSGQNLQSSLWMLLAPFAITSPLVRNGSASYHSHLLFICLLFIVVKIYCLFL